MKLKTIALISLTTGALFVGSLCQTVVGWLGKAPESAIAAVDSGQEEQDKNTANPGDQQSGPGANAGTGEGTPKTDPGQLPSSPKNFLKVEPNKK